MDNVTYPTGALQQLTGTMADPPVLSGTVNRPCFIDLSGTAFDKNFTLNLGTLGSELRVGDPLYVKFLSDGTARTMTCGTGFTSASTTATGSVSKYKVVSFIFNGTTFDKIGGTAA